LNKLVIFDLDNTFYNYQPTHERALNVVFEEQNQYDEWSLFSENYNLAKNTIHNRIGNNPSKHSKLLYFKEMFEEFLTFEAILNYEKLYWENFISFADISENDRNILNNKKDKNDIFILCTNQNTNIQLKKINFWNLDMFDFVITSEEVGYEKPNIEFYKYVTKIIKKLEISDFNFFAVGDDYENDIKFWIKNYDAKAYLVDNSNKNFIEEKEFIKTNFQMAIEDIFMEKF
tara:strand:+ start:1374 stop:2066 length:693 start_codon:yes stop_codon:yes gene_type:complete